MHGCKHSMGFFGIAMLVFGIAFLIADLTTWNFWGVQWWSVLFILFGLAHLMGGACKCNNEDKK